MKKLFLDVLISGAVLYGVSVLYNTVLTMTGLRDVNLVDALVIGYLTVRVTNLLRGK